MSELINNSMFPQLTLKGIDGNSYDTKDLLGKKATIVMFLSNTCPFVLALEDRIISLAKRYQKETGVSFIAICSNSNGDISASNSYENVKVHANKIGYNFPYLYDFEQVAMKEFGATKTPDFYLYDAGGNLCYHGRFDDCWKDESKVTKRFLEDSLKALLKSEPIVDKYIPTFGCEIKKNRDGICIDDCTELVLSKYVRMLNDGSDTILVNCLYGEVIEVSPDVISLLKLFEKPTTVFDISKRVLLPSNTNEIVNILFKSRFLVFADKDEYEDLYKRIRERESRVQYGALISILRINMSTGCNFRCTYCYMEKDTVHRNKDQNSQQMPLNIALDAAKAFLDNTIRNGRRRVSIRYIGGEPLLNKDVLFKTMEYIETTCKANGIYVTHLICTNGLLLDQSLVDFIKQMQDVQILVSLDGIKEVNDKVRLDINGEGTFDRVIEKIKLLVANDVSFGVPAVVDLFGLKHIDQFLEELSKIGVTRVGINPPYKFETDNPEFSSMTDLTERYFKAWIKAKKLGLIISGKAYLPEWHAMHHHIANCEGMGRSLVVDPDGSVSLCDKLDEKVGTIYDLETIFKSDVYKHFAMRVKGNIEECRDCEVSFLCNGGCLAEARNSYNKDYLTGNHCEFIKEMSKKMFKPIV